MKFYYPTSDPSDATYTTRKDDDEAVVIFWYVFCFICLALGVLIFTRSVLSALYLSKSATCTASWTFMHDVVRMVCKGKRNKCHGMANESIRYIMIYIFGIPIPEPEIVTDCH